MNKRDILKQGGDGIPSHMHIRAYTQLQAYNLFKRIQPDARILDIIDLKRLKEIVKDLESCEYFWPAFDVKHKNCLPLPKE